MLVFCLKVFLMDLGFLKKKDPFYYSIKELLNFKPKSLKFYKRAFTHRSLNKKILTVWR